MVVRLEADQIHVLEDVVVYVRDEFSPCFGVAFLKYVRLGWPYPEHIVFELAEMFEVFLVQDRLVDA